MTRHIHFCNIGLKPDPPLAICITSFPKDMVYLVNSPKSDGDAYTENELHIREHLSNVGIHNVETIHIHPYDFDSIIETIERTITKELSQDRECMFHFNITAGTNISAGAMCVVAMSTKNADIYHLREGKYCKPPTKQGELSYIELADMNSVRLLESRPRDAELLDLILESESIPHKTLLERSGMGGSLLSYHLKFLQENDLISRTGNNHRSPEWMLTEKGKKVFRRYKIRNT